MGMFRALLSSPNFIPYALAACILLLLVWIGRLEWRIHKMLRGKDGKSLEESFLESLKNLEKLNSFQREAIQYFEDVERRLNRSIQAVKTIRFNPWKGSGEGGNQSFSTVFMNENGEGAVISTLHSRDRISIFSKPIADFKSEFELTEEEKEAIEQSRKHLA